MKETLKKIFNKQNLIYFAIGIGIVILLATPWRYTEKEYKEAVNESYEEGREAGWYDGYEDAQKHYSELENDYNRGYKDALYDHIDEVDEKSVDVTCPDCGSTFWVWNDDGSVVAPPGE